MTSDADQHQLTSAPDAVPRGSPHWEQWLRSALVVGAFVLVLIAGIADGNLFGIHLSGALKPIADAMVIAGFVPVMLLGCMVMVRAMRRQPAARRSWTWGISLLIAGLFLAVLSFPWLYVDVSGLLPGWHLSRMQLVVVAVFLIATIVLWSIGAVLLCVAFIGEVWQWARYGRHQPPAAPSA